MANQKISLKGLVKVVNNMNINVSTRQRITQTKPLHFYKFDISIRKEAVLVHNVTANNFICLKPAPPFC